jgi:hypothetical protein
VLLVKFGSCHNRKINISRPLGAVARWMPIIARTTLRTQDVLSNALHVSGDYSTALAVSKDVVPGSLTVDLSVTLDEGAAPRTRLRRTILVPPPH